MHLPAVSVAHLNLIREHLVELTQHVNRLQAAERKMVEGQLRMCAQMDLVAALWAEPDTSNGDLPGLFAMMAPRICDIAQLGRISWWEFDAGCSTLACRMAHAVSRERALLDRRRDQATHASYLALLARGQLIAIQDCAEDDLGVALAAQDPPSSRMTAVLEVPVRVRRRLRGVLALEEIAHLRVWQAEERLFARFLGRLLEVVLERANVNALGDNPIR